MRLRVQCLGQELSLRARNTCDKIAAYSIPQGEIDMDRADTLLLPLSPLLRSHGQLILAPLNIRYVSTPPRVKKCMGYPLQHAALYVTVYLFGFNLIPRGNRQSSCRSLPLNQLEARNVVQICHKIVFEILTHALGSTVRLRVAVGFFETLNNVFPNRHYTYEYNTISYGLVLRRCQHHER